MIEKIKLFEEIFNQDVIDRNILNSLCFSGIPDKTNFRPFCWKLLLNYIPKKRDVRPDFLNTNRNYYESLIESLLLSSNGVKEELDHPLSSHNSGYWSSYFKDNEVLLQINKDVRRLYPHIQFFQTRNTYPCLNLIQNEMSLTNRVHQTLLRHESLIKTKSGVINFKKRTKSPITPQFDQNFTTISNDHREILTNDNHLNNGYSNDIHPHKSNQTTQLICYNNCSPTDHDTKILKAFSSDFNTQNNQNVKIDSHNNSPNHHIYCKTEYHWEVCQRLLFIYAKLNPGHGYIQGMNEIIGPIYYVMANDADLEQRKYAEHDTFFCFTNLMSEIRDNFTAHLDIDREIGIGAQMKKFHNMLEYLEPELLMHFKHLDLKLHYFGYRWIMLLFSQEFQLPDIIRLWDSLFATTDKGIFSIYIAVAMLNLIREELLQGDFAHNLKLLQKYPDNIDILRIISKSLEIEELALQLNLHKTMDNINYKQNNTNNESNDSINNNCNNTD